MTMIPAPTSSHSDMSVFERCESVVRSYCRSFPRKFTRAFGSWMYDDKGGRYLDFLTGCSSLNYGHNNPVLKQALLDYIGADGLAHGLDFHTAAKEEFLETFERLILVPRGLDYRVMFTGPTGANAVEAALKLARKATGRTNVLAFTNGFHGMTLGALAATGNAEKRNGAAMPLAGITRLPFDGYFGEEVNTAEQIDRMLSDPSGGIDAPAAFLVEIVQGEGGLNVASDAWLQRIAEIARKHEALLIIDDVQAGCGRTGPFFSFEPTGVVPDIVTLAKSLSGMGLPMAVTLFRNELDLWRPGEHNGTFRGNNHAFVTASAALNHFWRNGEFERAVERRSELLSTRLMVCKRHYPMLVRRIKGRGMMQGIEMASGNVAQRVTAACFERGLIIETSGSHDEVVKVLAPLTISEADFMTGLDILDSAIASISGSRISLVAH